jgi:MFS family permease
VCRTKPETAAAIRRLSRRVAVENSPDASAAGLPMKTLLRDPRVRRLLVANTLGSIGSGVTIFSVPWLLIHQPEGNVAFRWITIATTAVLFIFMPAYGAWVDRHSRKTALLASELWGFGAILALAGTGLMLGEFSTTLLMTIYFCGMFYYTLHYTAKFAFVQQILDRSQYQSLTGLMEIQGQTAMMIAGGLGGWLVEHVPLWTILLFDAATYLASFLILRTIPYVATHLTSHRAGDSTAAVRPTVWGSIVEAWRWLRARPRLAIFLTCSLLPFICVMAGNYLFPIYVAQTLHASAGLFAGGEIFFAAGAVLAGVLLPRLLVQHSAATTIPGAMMAFLGGLVVLSLFRHSPAYLAAAVLLGFGNAGCRVARSALMLNLVPNAVMGRVGVFYNLLDRVLRTILVSAMAITDVYGAPAGYGLLTGIIVLAIAGVLVTRNVLQPAEAGPALVKV